MLLNYVFINFVLHNILECRTYDISTFEFFQRCYFLRMIQSMKTLFVFLGIFTVCAIEQRQDRSIPIEHSCNRLPYILKDIELTFSYSAVHLTDQSCAVTIITAHPRGKVCVTFLQFYLDCDTDIILLDGTSQSQKKIYKCDSDHSSDFCTSKTSLEIIFTRKNEPEPHNFGHVTLKLYGKGTSDSGPASTLTVIVVIGGLFGLIVLLVVCSVIVSRALYHFRHKARLKRRNQQEQRISYDDLPLETPPPPYPGLESVEEERRINPS